MRFSNLLMIVVMFMLAFTLFSTPTMSHAELPPGGDAALMGLSDSVSIGSATVLADNDLVTTLAVAVRMRATTFNLMDEHNMTTPALYSWKPGPARVMAKPKGSGLHKGWHSPPIQRKILLA